MGLKDLVPDDAGDGKGGRPSEGDGEPRKLREDMYRPWRDGDEYWENLWEKHVDGDEPTLDEISSMVGEACVFPWDLKIHIEAAGIYEFDWDHMPDDYPSDDALAHWLRESGVINDFTKQHPPAQNDTTFSTGGDDDEDSGGLRGLVENAKE